MSALRQVLGGLLAATLVGGAVVASTVMAFAELGGSPTASTPSSATPVAISQLSATPLPTQAAPTRTLTPSATVAPPTRTPTAAPSNTATTVPPSATALPPTALPTTTAIPATPLPPPTTCVPSPPAGWVIYVIQRGDTLGALAQRFGVSQATLQSVNCLANPSGIQAGQRIYVPRLATDTPPPPVATSTPEFTATIPSDIPTITSMPVPSATPACAPEEFFDPFLNRCRLPDPSATPG